MAIARRRWLDGDGSVVLAGWSWLDGSGWMALAWLCRWMEIDGRAHMHMPMYVFVCISNNLSKANTHSLH